MRLQKKKKLIQKQCSICESKEALDCHRIKPGSKYTDWGTVIVCANCHRKIHEGKIEILGKFTSTAGILLNYTENGEEHMKEIKWHPN